METKMTEYMIAHYSRFSRTRIDTKVFEFCLFVDGSADVINSIREVEYVLDPSFPDPVRISSDPRHCFVLQSEAWGQFRVPVRIFTKDEQIVRLAHCVSLKDHGWPVSKPLTAFRDLVEQRIYETLTESLERTTGWRKLSTLARRAGITSTEAKGYLTTLEQQDAVRKAYYQSIDREELWGATQKVGLLPTAATSTMTSVIATEGTFGTEVNAERRDEGEETSKAAIEKRIAERAYELWVNEGRPQGRDLINWSEAEREIMASVERGLLPRGD
jgi:transcription initiation factor IIF auxiliary subunit